MLQFPVQVSFIRNEAMYLKVFLQTINHYTRTGACYYYLVRVVDSNTYS